MWENQEELKIAEVGSYTELVTAIDGDADIVKFTADIDAEETLVITRNLKLDLNGKKLYNTRDLWIDGGETSNCVIKVNGENIDVILVGYPQY